MFVLCSALCRSFIQLDLPPPPPVFVFFRRLLLYPTYDRDMPPLPDQEEEEEGPGGISLWEGGVGGDGSGYTGPFEESERCVIYLGCHLVGFDAVWLLCTSQLLIDVATCHLCVL